MLVVLCSATVLIHLVVLSARETSHPQPPVVRPQRTVGVLAGTHWGGDSFRVMSHQSANSVRAAVLLS